MKPLAFALCFGAVACGGGALPASKTTGSEEDLTSFLDDSAAQMEREVVSLESSQLQAEQKPEEAPAGGESGGEEPQQAPPDAPAAPVEATATSDREGVDDEGTKEPSKRERCALACRSLASMKRSEARICEITGEGHAKCTWAHERVKDAVARIERAGCDCKK